MVNKDLTTFYERKKNTKYVGDLVTIDIYNNEMDKKIKGLFIIIDKTEQFYVGLNIALLDMDDTSKSNFIQFDGERQEEIISKNYHDQIHIFFDKGKIARSYRVINSFKIGGIADVDLENLHTFLLDTPFKVVGQLEETTYNEILYAFFDNRVIIDEYRDTVLRDLYFQYFD